MNSERSMTLRFGGYMYATPAVPGYVIDIARSSYRRRRGDGQSRHDAKSHVAKFLLSSVSVELRPTAAQARWLAELHAEATS